ncbi:MAG: hypothetical protein WC677_05665 [Clostridia bacterium]|jgi:hypothetical protein
MRSPKKFLAMLIAVTMLTVYCVPAMAAVSEPGVSTDAKICADIGMLNGVDANGVTIAYTQSTPTRMQAARILLRFKGLEGTATSFTGTTNFRDFRQAKTLGAKRIMAYLKVHPAIGFLGFANNTFRPNTAITTKQFYKVMLTALGYVQGIDFEYESLFTFAASKGLALLNADTVFTVEAMATAMVETLRATLADGSTTLAQSMLADGLLDPELVEASGLLGPAPTPTETPTPTPPTMEALDSTATYLSSADATDISTIGYTMTTGQVTGYPSRTTGIQRLEFDVTPLINNVNGALSIADGSGDVTSVDNLVLSIGLNAAGNFDCTNGGTATADATVPYVANTKYHVVLVANMDTKSYDVWVTPDAGTETKIASNYLFKTTAFGADDMGKVYFRSAAGNDLKFETVVRKSVYTNGQTYSAFEENGGWQDNGLFLGYGYTGTVTIEYDATASKAQADGSIDFAGANVNLTGFGDLSMLIRFSGVTAADFPGAIDVRNGSAGNVFKSDVQIIYTGGTVYHFRVVANMTDHTYSVWVTPAGGSETKIATDYGFRPTALANDIGQVFVVSAYETDLVSLTNLSIVSSDFTPTPTPSFTVAPTPTSTVTPSPTETTSPTETPSTSPTETPTPTVTTSPTETPSPSPTETPSVTPTPTPPSGVVTVNNNAELAAALGSAAVTTINFNAGTYEGFIINYPVIINGNGENLSFGIIINASNVTVNNLDIIAASSLASNPAGEPDNKHGISIAPNLTGIVINGGSISCDGLDDPINKLAKAIFFQPGAPVAEPLTDEMSNNGSATINNVTFTNVRNGVVCNGADSLIITNCTFSGMRVGIGSTEFTTLTTVTGNQFTNCPSNISEAIGIGDAVVYTGQADIPAFLLANNTWDGTFTSGLTGNRIRDYRAGGIYY